MKRFLLIALAVLLAAGLAFAQAAEESIGKQEMKTQIFVDDLGREVVLPADITRIAPSGSNAQVLVFQVAPEKLVGIADKLTGKELEIYPEYTHDIPVLGTLYGKKANLNREALILSNPEVVIDVGDIKGSAEDMAKELDKVSSDVGVPVIFIEANMDNYPDVFRKLGKLLGVGERAEKLASYYDDVVAQVCGHPSNKMPRVYITSSNDGLNAVIAGKNHAQCAEKAGAEVVTTSKLVQSNGNVSLETLYQLDPSYIFAYTEEGYRTITTSDLWANLRAVRNNKVYLVPSVPHWFIDNPTGTNRIIGLYYLGSIFYPELEIDIVEKTKEFYSLFYGKDLSDDMVRDILHMN